MNTPTRPTAPAITASPRTPQRGISSTFSSPGYGREEDSVIFELGARHLRAGLAHDNTPRCTLEFGPEQSRRLGDYRKWLPGYENRVRRLRQLDAWTRDYELWQLDSRDYDLAMVENKLERAFRTAYTEHLLLDAKSRRVVLVVPALTSHALLSKILSILFGNFQMSSVTLVPPPTMAVVAAGQRSGLVVDIGWHETIITAVYEFREIAELRSTRAMKHLVRETARFLRSLPQVDMSEEDETERTNLDFEYVEELVTQVIWCLPAKKTLQVSKLDRDKQISLSLPLPTSKPISIPVGDLARPVEKALFADAKPRQEQDDHERSLDLLLYQSLLRLPQDIRSICMSRIMFTGGGANIPGLKTRLLDDLEALVAERGWNPIWGASPIEARPQAKSVATSLANTDSTMAGAGFEEQIHDTIREKLHVSAAKLIKPQPKGHVRGIETMGAFVGASLASALQIKSLVEIDKELFLQHGLTGPKKEDSSLSRPKSLGGAYSRAPTVDTRNASLGAWA